MRAVVFGQSGIQKDKYLTEVLKVARGHDKNFEIVNLGTRMHKLDPGKRHPEIYPSLPVFERELLRKEALKSVIHEIGKSPDGDYVLNAHAVFKLDTGLVPATDADLIKEFAPEIIVVLIDDFHYIHRRLQGTAFEKLSYSAILEWRDAEITAAKTSAQGVFKQEAGPNYSADWRFYVLARGHHPQVLYRLLYERNQRLKIYSSFAITGATIEQRNKISEFKSRLAQKHIVFDPFKIAERGMFALADSLLEEMADKCRGVKEIDAAYLALIGELKNHGVENPEREYQGRVCAFGGVARSDGASVFTAYL